MSLNLPSSLLGDQGPSDGSGIDSMMDRASRALVETDYFEAERLSERALRQARSARDFERMARICLPLQEARRQKRLIALDAGFGLLICKGADVPRALEPGVYLLQPPMIGAEARTLREHADRKKVPALVLCREPMTRDGRWPMVAVGPRIFRAKVATPEPLERVEDHVTKDRYSGLPPASWFEMASEALGDAGFAALPDVEHPDFRVDDLLDLLDAHPGHEKLHQWLAEACRVAVGSAPPTESRRLGFGENPFGF